jgi:hypothetical protein
LGIFYSQVQTAQHGTDQAIATYAAPATYTSPADPLVPPPATIWFGTSFDTTTLDVSGQASSFGQGDPVVMVAHFTRVVPGGQSINILLDGVIIKSTAASASDYDLFGMALNSALLPAGQHTLEIDDVGGNMLASGIVTITR